MQSPQHSTRNGQPPTANPHTPSVSPGVEISNPQHDLTLKHGEVHEHAGHTTQQLPYPRFFQQSGRRCFGDESGHLYSYSYFIFLLPDSS